MTDDHLSLDELAELDEGLLSAERMSAFRAHLQDCDACRAKADAITSARAMLSNLPPVTMPADIRARLDRAIGAAADADADADETADEAATGEPPFPAPRAVVPGSGPDPEPTPTIDTTQRTPDVMPAPGTVVRPRFGRPTAAASSVAAALVLAIGAIIVAHFHHGNSPQDSTAAQNFGAESPADGGTISTVQPTNFVKSSTGLEYTAANLATTVRGVLARTPTDSAPAAAPTAGGASGAGAVGGAAGTTAGTQKAGKADDKPAGGSATSHRLSENAPQSSGGTAYGSSTQSTLALEDAPIPAVLRPLADSQKKILACAATLTGERNAVPEHVDFARWTGGTFHNAPSAIFIFRGASPSTVAVYVTNPTCGGNLPVRSYTKVLIDN